MTERTFKKLKLQAGVEGGWTFTAEGKRGTRTTVHAPTGAYVRVDTGQISRTKELVKDRVFADFDKKGNLVGVEIV